MSDEQKQEDANPMRALLKRWRQESRAAMLDNSTTVLVTAMLEAGELLWDKLDDIDAALRDGIVVYEG